MKRRPSPSGRVVWFVVALAVAALSVIAAGPLGGSTWARPELLFTVVIVTAATCVIAATVVIALADRREMAEIGLLGTALMAASVLPLVHGLVTPGVLYDDNDAFRTSMFLALPVAVAVATPLLAPATRFGSWAARRWRDWTLLSLLGVFVLASVVVIVRHAIATVPTLPIVARLDAVGRDADVLLDTVRIPADIGDILVAVDAEI